MNPVFDHGLSRRSTLRLGVLVNVFENKIDEAALGARNHT